MLCLTLRPPDSSRPEEAVCVLPDGRELVICVLPQQDLPRRSVRIGILAPPDVQIFRRHPNNIADMEVSEPMEGET